MSKFAKTTFQYLDYSEHLELSEFLEQFTLEPNEDPTDELWWENYMKRHPEIMDFNEDVPF